MHRPVLRVRNRIGIEARGEFRWEFVVMQFAYRS
jgi:hypothetical protein